jgi:hypothetical protein
MIREAKARNVLKRATLMLLGAAALSALALTPAAEAHKKHKRHHKHKVQVVHHSRGAVHVTPARHTVFVPSRRVARAPVRYEVRIPRHIHRHQVAVYRPYYGGEVYFEPHRHYHAVYYFPVKTRYGYDYRRRHYCNGVLHTGGHVAYHGSHVSFRVDF